MYYTEFSSAVGPRKVETDLLFPKEEISFLQQNCKKDAYFALLSARSDTAQKKQFCFPVEKMDWVIDHLDVKADTWISQSTFFAPSRRIVCLSGISSLFLDLDYYKTDWGKNKTPDDVKADTWISQSTFFAPSRRIVCLSGISSLFLDLDYYKTDWGKNKTPEEAANHFVRICQEVGIPIPSLIVFSGRGLQIKWLLSYNIPRAALPRWNLAQQKICRRLAPYGADANALDAARVLRVLHTTNTRSGRLVRAVFVNSDIDGPVRYNFEDLCNALFEFRRDELISSDTILEEFSKRAQKPILKGLEAFNLNTLNFARADDLLNIIQARGGIAAGNRMNWLLYTASFLALSHQLTPLNFYHEVRKIAFMIDPGFRYSNSEFSTLYAKIKAYTNGETVMFNGREYPAIYTPKNETIIEKLGITEEEIRSNKTIVDTATRRKKDAERSMKRRRAQGTVSREEYDKQRSEQKRFNLEAIARLKKEGLSIRAIAEQLKLNERVVRRYAKEITP